MRADKAKHIALGGMLAAAALVIMCMGGMIPLATYVCPVLCTLVQYIVLRLCGKRIAWTWYCVVAVLGLLIGPDKEAAAVFMFLGYYPMLKPVFEKNVLQWLWKLLLFNGVVVLMYTVFLRLLGLNTAAEELNTLGVVGLVAMLLLGNATFFLLDRLLTMAEMKWRKR